jgi:D-amino peptidase
VDGLDRRASVISGQPLPQEDFFYGLDSSFTALYLVGFHARAGTPNALLPHTYDDDIVSVKVNATEVGEIGLEAALAGKFGVPLAFVSGDSGGIREARELLGGDVETVEVKQAITETSGVCLPAAKTRRMLRDAAYRALRKARSVPPVVFQCILAAYRAFVLARSQNGAP